MAHSHANPSGYQNCPAAEVIHPQDSRNGEDKLEDTSNACGEQGSRVCTEVKVFEDLGAVILVRRCTGQRQWHTLTRSS